MRKIIFTIFLTSVFAFANNPISSATDRGIIGYVDTGRNILVIMVDSGYGEQYTCASYITNFSLKFPCEPAIGDLVYGEFNSYGSYDIYNDRLEGKFSIWVEEFWLSRDDAIRWINNHY